MDKITKFFVAGLLGLMFVLMFFSSYNDAATFDEVAHIPAGYSYLTKQDYRLNPEHPPLIKDLSAVPLLFLNLNFPTDVPEWSGPIERRQWDMGKIFLYRAGNDADKILHFSRFPIMVLALAFGWMLFDWARKNYGNKVGLLTVFFYALSPTFIAHSRFVTTDLGAAFGFFIAIASFIKFLQNQNRKNLIVSGLCLGIAFLLKFSTVILGPLFIAFAVLWAVLENYGDWKKILKKSFLLVGKTALVGIIALVLVWIVYAFHVWNYPVEQQVSDIKATLTSPLGQKAGNILAKLSYNSVIQPIADYFFGVISVVQRAAGGNSYYFMGKVSSQADPLYFPILYAVKEQLVFHILTLIAVIFSISNIIKSKEKNFKAAAEWMKDNFAVTASLVFVFAYLLQSITGNLNIGVRHIMPVMPFIYFVVARQIIRWMQEPNLGQPANFKEWLSGVLKQTFGFLGKYALVSILLLWMFFSAILTFPYYLSYYNVLGGGVSSGYKIATDSNYDWGQDMKRLKDWMEDNDVEKIKLHYFGGGDGRYYFGDNYEDWWSSKGQPVAGSWLAISANAREGSMAKPTNGFIIPPGDDYWWLKGKEPVARAGSSIFIYKF